jgi:hypothetical protein
MAHSNVRPLGCDDIFFYSWDKGYVVESTMWNNSDSVLRDHNGKGETGL